jgi:hypothetical protein
VAVGWATVELDRAAAELTLELGIAATFEPAADDAALGARRGWPRPRCRCPADGRGVCSNCRQRVGWPPLLGMARDRPRWLSPAMVRRGDGDRRPHGCGIEVATRDGPLGPAMLILDAPIPGPYRFLLVDRTGTIAS